ncbi:transposase [Streptomyces griseofuscus]|uniref:transposase n=1 Tax=Streptomyces griseofuscus TaxID=146922 RepID=UPI0037A7D93B
MYPLVLELASPGTGAMGSGPRRGPRVRPVRMLTAAVFALAGLIFFTSFDTAKGTDIRQDGSLLKLSDLIQQRSRKNKGLDESNASLRDGVESRSASVAPKESKGTLSNSADSRKGIESSQRLGRYRWTVERTVAWLAGCRRLHRRYERKAEHFLAFAGIAATLICYRRLTR